MTNPTYEVNVEKLSDLSIADLITLSDHCYRIYEFFCIKDKNKASEHKYLSEICSSELNKRINDIIIF